MTSQQTFRKYPELDILGNSYSPSTGKAEEGDKVQGLFGIGSGVLSPQKDDI